MGPSAAGFDRGLIDVEVLAPGATPGQNLRPRSDQTRIESVPPALP